VHPTLFTLSFGDLPMGALPLLAVAALIMGGAAALALRGGGRRLGGLALACAVVALALGWLGRHRVVHLGALPMRSYGLLLFVGLGGAWWLSARAWKRAGLRAEGAERGLMAALVSGVVMARVGYLILNDGGASLATLVALEQGGLCVSVGLVSAAAAAAAVLRGSGVPLRRWADGCVLPAGWLLASGAAASYLSGSDFGIPLHEGAPTALASLGTFSRAQLGPSLDGPPVLLAQIASGSIARDAVQTLPVHPTQLYDLVVAIGIGVLGAWPHHQQRRSGRLFLVAVVALGTAEFVLDLLRGDADRGLLPWHVPSLVLVLSGLGVLGAIAVFGTLRASPSARRPRTVGGAVALGLLLGVVAARAHGPVLSPSVPQLLAWMSAVVAAVELSRDAAPAAA
jgi:phosphatidylglycerol:prolipoprotein diacylglycerol transferase